MISEERKKEEGRRKKEEGVREKVFHPSSFLLRPFLADGYAGDE
jgi:hypothetical protein